MNRKTKDIKDRIKWPDIRAVRGYAFFCVRCCDATTYAKYRKAKGTEKGNTSNSSANKNKTRFFFLKRAYEEQDQEANGCDAKSAYTELTDALCL